MSADTLVERLQSDASALSERGWSDRCCGPNCGLASNLATEAATRITELERDKAALEGDARRYRHMRANAKFEYRNGPGLYWYLPRNFTGTPGEQLDKAIDRAQEQGK